MQKLAKQGLSWQYGQSILNPELDEKMQTPKIEKCFNCGGSPMDMSLEEDCSQCELLQHRLGLETSVEGSCSDCGGSLIQDICSCCGLRHRRKYIVCFLSDYFCSECRGGLIQTDSDIVCNDCGLIHRRIAVVPFFVVVEAFLECRF